MTINHTGLADVGDRIRASEHTTSNDRNSLISPITSEDMQPYSDRVARWIDGDTTGIDTLVDTHGVSRITVPSMVDTPYNRSFSIPVFFSWLRLQGIEPFARAAALPTSPRNAFPTWAEAGAAARAWERDTDPRLADDMIPGTSSQAFRRSELTRPANSYTFEMRRAWEADAWPERVNSYSSRFWDEVRRLGYGTPAWTTPPTTTTTTQETTVTFATPAQMRDYRSLTREQMEPWRKTFIRFVTETEAAGQPNGMTPGWLTSDEDPATTDESTLRRAIERPDRMPGTIGRYFREWLEANGITQPDDLDLAAVPSGDSVIPIGPDHPGWEEFWERARRAAGPSYRDYWQTLADSMGYTPPVRNERVTVALTYHIAVEVPEGGRGTAPAVAAQAELHRLIRSGRDLNRYTDTVVRREPVSA